VTADSGFLIPDFGFLIANFGSETLAAKRPTPPKSEISNQKSAIGTAAD